MAISHKDMKTLDEFRGFSICESYITPLGRSDILFAIKLGAAEYDYVKA